VEGAARRTSAKLAEATEELAQPAQDDRPGIVSQLLAALPSAADILAAMLIHYSREGGGQVEA